MIKTGTKIIILSSSCRKKTGPRKGSIGFVSQMKQYGSEISYIEEEDVFVNLTRVVFTRYGFESKERMELKYFMNVLPNYMAKRKIGPVLINKSAEVMKSDHTRITLLKRRYMDVYGKTAALATVGVMVPIQTTDNIMSFSDNIFSAWLYSFLRENRFIWLVRKACAKPGQVSNIISLATLDIMGELCRDNTFRKEMLPKIAQDTKMKESTIDLVRKLNTIGNISKYRKRTQDASNWIKNKRIRSNKDLIDAGYLIVDNLYSPTDPIQKVGLLRELNNSSSSVETFKRVLGTKDKLLCLGQSLEKKKGKGKEV